MKYIVYTKMDDEVIVTSPEDEAEMLKVYFAPDSGRDLEEYDRDVLVDSVKAVTITARLHVDPF